MSGLGVLKYNFRTHNERDSGKEYWQRWSDGKFRGRMRLRFLILSLSP